MYKYMICMLTCREYETRIIYFTCMHVFYTLTLLAGFKSFFTTNHRSVECTIPLVCLMSTIPLGPSLRIMHRSWPDIYEVRETKFYMLILIGIRIDHCLVSFQFWVPTSNHGKTPSPLLNIKHLSQTWQHRNMHQFSPPHPTQWCFEDGEGIAITKAEYR